MILPKYRTELSELTEIWDCDERTAIQRFLHVIYIMRRYCPKDVEGFINHLSDEWLAHCFVEFMDDRFKPLQKEIDLLSIQPEEDRNE